jgi:hypothetical protein
MIKHFATAGVGLLLFSTTAYAQATACPPHGEAYDAYKPSHLAIVREYGGTVMAHAPLSTLLRLDPYIPAHAELLRQVGRGLPLWPVYPGSWYAPPPAVAVPACEARLQPPSSSAPPITSLADALSMLQREPAAGTNAAVTSGARVARSERNKGVMIHYDGRAWVSAGMALPFRDAEFSRVGESGGFPVFRRRGTKDDVIYVPTLPEMVAPFQAIR